MKFETPVATKPLNIQPSFTPAERKKEVMPPGLSKPEEDARYFPQLKRF